MITLYANLFLEYPKNISSSELGANSLKFSLLLTTNHLQQKYKSVEHLAYNCSNIHT